MKKKVVNPAYRKGNLFIYTIKKTTNFCIILSFRKRSAPAISFSISQPTAPSVPVTKKSSFRSNIRVNAYKKIPIELWSEQHVQEFFYDNKLDVMVLLTENMNGEELDRLLQICQTEHERWIMFDRLNQELEKRYQQTLTVSVYLRFLNRIQKYTNISAF